MKANEAPKRIWIDPATDLQQLSGHIDKDSVEYTRTDAFIKKACFWLELNLSDRPKEDIKFWLEDFRQYMEE